MTTFNPEQQTAEYFQNFISDFSAETTKKVIEGGTIYFQWESIPGYTEVVFSDGSGIFWEDFIEVPKEIDFDVAEDAITESVKQWLHRAA